MGWLASKRESNHELKSRNDDRCPHKLKDTRSIIIAEEDLVGWLASKRESNKSRNDDGCPQKVKEKHSINIAEEDDSPSNIGQMVIPKKLVCRISPRQEIIPEPEVKERKCVDDGKENWPMRTKESNLLILLNSQHQKTGIPSTPNLVLKINQRKEECKKGCKEL
jgi:hypothetical protein